jgi:large subunit ribosomal protein L23
MSQHRNPHLNPYNVIISPVLTEKATMVLMNHGKLKKYVFKVHQKATKTDIKEAVEKIFNVKVQKVNTINIPKKMKHFRYRYNYFRPSYKKAIVTLKEGYSITEIDSSIEKESTKQ